MENEKGVVVRFVIGRRFSSFVVVFLSSVINPCQRNRCWSFEPFILIMFFSCSANHGDGSDKSIDSENRENKDFIILVCHLGLPIDFLF